MVFCYRRSTPPPLHQQAPQPQPSPPQQQRTTTPIATDETQIEATNVDPPEIRHSPPAKASPVVQRAISMPTASPEERTRPNRPTIGYSQSERLPNRPNLARSMSRKEIIKNYLKKETATFFGVDEENEEKEQRIWLDRRIRMASR